MFLIQSADNRHCMARAVEEIRIAKGDMPSAGGHLPPDVFEHNLCLYNSELSAVNRHDRTVPAQMLTPAARFRVPDNALVAVGRVQMRVVRKRRQTLALRCEELLFGERDH